MGVLQEVVPQGEALSRALELAAVIAAYPNFPGICADRHALLAGLSLDLDAGLLLEAKVVRAALASDELAAGLRRFGEGARDASPRPPTF
jgi:enoyl-CoA hydratase/carnithine racemase